MPGSGSMIRPPVGRRPRRRITVPVSARPSLVIHRPVLLESGVTKVFVNPPAWRRSIRLDGGFWQGVFRIDTTIVPDLFDPFYKWLGFHLVERTSGITSWEGMIYEAELSYNGIRRLRSLDTMYNAIDVSYQVDGEVSRVGWASQTQSIDRYGLREQILSADNVPTATAQGYRDTFLGEHAWPWARPVALGLDGDTWLEFRVCGYVHTANWMHVKAGDGTSSNVNDYIKSIVGTAHGLSSDHGGSVSGAGDCQFLKAGNLATNTLQVPEEVQSDTRAWSHIANLAALGDSNGDRWIAAVDRGRVLNYTELDLSPRYYLRQGMIYDRGGTPMTNLIKARGDPGPSKAQVNPWLIRPGVIRDMAYPVRRAERGSMFADARDSLITEVEIGIDGLVSLKTAGFDEADILAAQLELQRG